MPFFPIPPKHPLFVRFWSKVTKNGPVAQGMTTPCWLWLGATDRLGYGSITIRKGKTEKAHRVSYALEHGEIALGLLDVLHRCDVRSCVRPDHLFQGTHVDNMKDMVQKGRSARGIRNGRHTKPERTARGFKNGRHTHPESTARGDRHGFRLHPETVARGSRSGRAKLTEALVQELRQKYKDGDTQTALAKFYGLSSRNVSSIVRRQTWTHVGGP